MKSKIFYPFLLAVYQVLFLYAHNISEIPASLIVLPAFYIILFTTAGYYLLKFFLKSRYKAGFLLSIGIFLFFSYGHIFYNFLIGFKLFGITIGRHRFLFPLWCCMFAVSAVFMAKSRIKFYNITEYFNKLSVVLVVIALCNIGINAYRASVKDERIKGFGNNRNSFIGTRTPAPLPDVYYILLDGYTGNDTLERVFNYDNSEFTDYLRRKGFYIPPKAVSNYPCAYLTLASELNLKHVTFLSDELGADSPDKSIPYKMIKDNEVVSFLKGLGYKYIHFDSQRGMDSRNRHADLRVRSEKFNSFMMLTLRTSMVSPFLKFIDADMRRYRILNAFGKLAQIPDMKEPTYTFVHIMAIHPPFVFGPTGEKIQPAQVLETEFNEEEGWGCKKCYLNQLFFINKKTKMLIDTLLSKSETPPIIILQAAHGSSSIGNFANPTDEAVRERMSILNAYYFPAGGDKVLYKNITPVNSFRMMFKYYFGVNLKPLPDSSFFSDYHVTPYKFTDVTKILKE